MEGVQPLKGGDVANIVEPQMEKTKENNPKRDWKVRKNLRERKKKGLQKMRLNTSTASTMLAAIEEPIIETRKASLAEKLDRDYQHFSDIEEAEGGDPEPKERKVLSGLVFLAEIQYKLMQELSGGCRMCTYLLFALVCTLC